MTKVFDWREHWVGMPHFACDGDNKKSKKVIRVWRRGAKNLGKPAFVTVHFRETEGADIYDFETRMMRQAANCTRTDDGFRCDIDEAGLSQLLFNGEHKIGHHSCWYPWKGNAPHSDYEYRQEGKPVNPEYPVYVISKGRWELPLTARALERMGVPYTIVVEPKEYHSYAARWFEGYDGGNPYTGKIQVAPENFSERGQGSIPVRNYVWDLARKTRAARHWLMDDNIPTFNRTNHNLGIHVKTGAIFRAVEDFADRYENVAITGLQNAQFVQAKYDGWPAFSLNTRVYSCTLIKNDLRLTDGLSKKEIAETDGRWRGRYNEDTDLCIRALKAGWCTVLFVTLNSDKVGTMTMKGGNTDELYAGDPTQLESGRHKMAYSLAEQHPDVACVKRRFASGRFQHVVDYKKCVELGRKAKPKWGMVPQLKPGVKLAKGTNNFGMVLIEKATGKKAKEFSEK